ncbi:MAG: hypothetical protein DMG59_27585 [Acidobacteria bacterium]|jgi:hypothetical protein|nr:MAG: hypothetical protein DMG59_27585 [Acidobacteriota bacterium]
MLAIQVFLYLQLLDFLTTMVGFRIGAGELSPFTRWLMLWGPIAGVALSKLIAILLGGLCIWRRRGRVISWANYYFAGVVAWNLCIILNSPGMIP